MWAYLNEKNAAVQIHHTAYFNELCKKTEDPDQRKVFDLKAKVYLDICSGSDNRRFLSFECLQSKNFRVIKFCDNCTKKNTEEKREKHSWKFCGDCANSRNFIILCNTTDSTVDSMVFLSNDLMDENTFQNQKPQKR